MDAIDTNIVVRFLADDEPIQSARARAIVSGSHVFLPTTVILETEWVLRYAYGMTANQVADRLSAFAGLPTVHLEDPSAVEQALAGLARGLDFADALHLATARDSDALLTFDRRFAARARRLGLNVRIA